MIEIRDQFTNYIHQLQKQICSALEVLDGEGMFVTEEWERDGGGGGITKVLANGAVFEKAGVNTSVVYGKLPQQMKDKFEVESDDFFACGISLVLHPLNPFVPTVHANFRYFEILEGDKVIDQWFGGGADLTPYYLFEEDVMHFHNTWKKACDRHDITYYPKFKSWCDEYFYNSHRQENRGVGGIFFDYLKPENGKTIESILSFVKDAGEAFLEAYVPIIEKRRALPFSDQQRYWQEIRRGRYVEFNLIHDRGTTFGLKTNGRTESILMSLPPRVRWDYDFKPEADSEEEKMIKALTPQNWI